MRFEDFATAVGYIVIIWWIITIVVIIIMYLFGSATGKECFSIARMSVQSGIPGPVWWYYPMKYRKL